MTKFLSYMERKATVCGDAVPLSLEAVGAVNDIREAARIYSVLEMGLHYIVRYGNDEHMRLTPHRYQDGKFRVRKDSGNWIAVDEREIESYLRRGYILRMSARGHSASGICPKSIEGWK